MQCCDTALHKLGRIFVIKKRGLRCFFAELDDLLHVIRDATAAVEHADNFTFIVSDGEFVERPDSAADEQDNIRRTHIDKVPPLESETGVDDRVSAIVRKPVALHMLASILRRRNAERKSTVPAKRVCHQVRNPGGRAGHENTACLRD